VFEMWSRLVRFLTPYLYLAPSLLVIGLFVYVPLVRTVQLSFYQGNLLNPQRVLGGLGQLHRVAQQPYFLRAARPEPALHGLRADRLSADPVSLAF
jgi:ABC-type sugar transport system permease subunit